MVLICIFSIEIVSFVLFLEWNEIKISEMMDGEEKRDIGEVFSSLQNENI